MTAKTTKFNPYELINQATEICKLKEIESNYWVGLLVPPKDGSIYPYSRPVLCLEIYLMQKQGLYAAFACVISNDDSGMNVYGPYEDADKALIRMNKFKDKIIDWGYMMPNEEDIKDICEPIGLFPNYW